MPPANSPTETPPDDAAASANSPYLAQFAQLASPVPDLAATLSTQAEQDAEDDNVSFLRTRLPTPPPQDDTRDSVPLRERLMPEARTPPLLRDARSGQVIPRTDAEHRRMRRAVAATAEAAARYSQERASVVEPTYADRISQQPSRGYLGWAPGDSSDEEGESNAELRYGGEGSSRFYNEWSSRMRELRTAQSSRRELSQLLDQVSHTQDELDSYLRVSRDSNQNDQASSHTSTRLPPLPQYLLDRERHAIEDEEEARRRYQRNHDRATMILEQRRRQQLLSEVQQRASRVPNEESRQPYDNAVASSVSVIKTLEETIKYLGRIKNCVNESEQIFAAHNAGLITEEFSRDWDDFMFHRSAIKPPPETSWFKSGGVFSGSQHAAGASCLQMPYLANRSGASTDGSAMRRRTRVARSDQEELFLSYTSPAPTASSRNYRRSSNLATTGSRSRAIEIEERWPVKVRIHHVDYSTMTLSGTMEAFNVPDKSSPTQESSITTFLEGEIIDFNVHTLETETYNANTRVDATYWRKLEPFKLLTEKEMIKSLVSKRWLNEDFSRKWILMRWKEKCFVKPSDAQSSLTISGFYYVSLRREDGHVEGLYYDPSSTPYQYLSLMPEGLKTFPTFTFT